MAAPATASTIQFRVLRFITPPKFDAHERFRTKTESQFAIRCAVSSSRERMQRGDGFPLVLLRDHTPHKLTTETPTELPMEQRVAAHHAALDALLTHYAVRS